MQMQQADISVIYDDAQAFRAVGAALSSYFGIRQIPLETYAAGASPDTPLSIFCVNMGVRETAEQIKKAIRICGGETLGDQHFACFVPNGTAMMP